MRRLLAAVLVLWAPASAGAQTVSSLRMRTGEADLDSAFDGRRPERPLAGIPADLAAIVEALPPSVQGTPVEPPPDAAKPGRGDKVLLFLDKAFGLEASLSAGPGSVEALPQGRVDIGAVLDVFPPLLPGTGHGWKAFLVDASIIQGLTAAGLAASYGAGKALGIPRLTGRAEAFVRYTAEHGPIGAGPISFKDPNYGDPWINELGHPAAFFAVGRYFQKRGYGVLLAFAGAMTANALWEYLWENSEIPKSGHDLFYMNVLGGLFGAHPDLGLAWGTSLVNPGDPLGHYTEFYYRKPGSRWRLFHRVEPNGNYNAATAGGPEPKTEDKPLFVTDLSLGVADERTGLSLFLTGVSDTDTKSFGEVGGVGDVFDGVRLGVSVDPTVVWRRLR